MTTYRLYKVVNIKMISKKGVYGMVSGSITTALLQPFQNVKMALMIPPYKLRESHANNNVLTNIKTSCSYIYSHHGIPGFYKGLVAATLKAALGCYIYFTGLRAFEQDEMSPMQNFLASSISRLVSTLLTNPLSVIETRFELPYFDGYGSVMAAVRDIKQREGLKGFFGGGMAACIKQGTFGGFHYMFYEELKDLGYGKMVSGITSGMLAATITHPFEIIRAKLQTIGLYEQHSFTEHSIIRQLRSLMREGGWLRGLAPRLVKKPFANTLTFLMFEILEQHRDGQFR